MLITPDFVFLHMPKTGGTFVRSALKKLYPDALEGKKHGTCAEIPKKYSHLPRLSIVRNPFDRYVSQYHYGWWKQHFRKYSLNPLSLSPLIEPVDLDAIGFEDFLYIADKYFKGHFIYVPDPDNPGEHISKQNGYRDSPTLSTTLGWHTEQYIHFYFHQPLTVFNTMTDDVLKNMEFLNAAYTVDFLHTETLNSDLHQFLVNTGHPAQKVDFILNTEKVLPDGGKPRAQNDNWRRYYNTTMLSFVARRERLILSLHPIYKEVS